MHNNSSNGPRQSSIADFAPALFASTAKLRCVRRARLTAEGCQSAGGHAVGADLIVKKQNIPFSSVLSQYSSVTLLRLRGLRHSSAIVATRKIFDWD